MWLVAGLGNVGSQYAQNRHNVGFMVADLIAETYGFAPWKKKFQGQLADGKVGEDRLLLLKPETYMNLSGQAVGEAARFHKIAPANVLVFHDELDLPAGKIRVKLGGGHGGHNGLRSIDAALTPNYHRVRVGIGRPEHKEQVHSYVLNDFSQSDRQWLEPLLKSLVKHLPLLLKGDEASYQNKIALDVGSIAK